MDDFKSRVTIYGVAKASGVSLATVSRVINNKGIVKEETRIKVEKAIEKLGYKPNLIAQSLAVNKNKVIGVVISSNVDKMLETILEAIIVTANRYGWRVLVFPVEENTRKSSLYNMNEVVTSNVLGAVMFDNVLTPDDIRQVTKYNVPVVVLNHYITGDNLASISFDFEKDLVELIKNHCRQNKKKIYFCRMVTQGYFSTKLEQVFVDTMSKVNKPFLVKTVSNNYDEVYAEFIQHFKDNKEGLYLANREFHCEAIINAAIDSGLRIPEDIEVLSIAGSGDSLHFRPKISTLTSDWYQVGVKCIEMIHGLLADDIENKHYSSPCYYYEGDTTAK